MGIDLITLAEYKKYIGINSTNQDTQIKTLIPIVSQFAKTFCARTFVDYVTDDCIQVFSGGHDRLLLSEYPLLSVNAVDYSNDYGKTYTALEEYTDYTIDTEDDIASIKAIRSLTPFVSSTGVFLFSSEDYVFPRKSNAYRVAYNAGFETVPSDLKIAVMDLLTYYLKNDAAVKSSRSAGSSTVQVEYITKNTLPAHIGRVFDIYTSAWN